MEKQDCPKVLITDTVHPTMLPSLEAAGFACDYCPAISLEEVHRKVAAYYGLVINSKIVADKALFDKATRLRFVARLGSGMEIIDQQYAAQKGVSVYNSPEGNCNAVAEHALGMLLALMNNLARADREVRAKVWEREAARGYELAGLCVGIYGYGHTGSAFAQKLSGMGVQVLAYDKYKTGFANLPHLSEATPADIFQRADVLSFHLPLTHETHHLANADFFDQFSKPIWVINTSRGTVIDTPALLSRLQNGRVRGACLDVFENEKVNTFTPQEHALYDALYALDNVLLSPHVAGWTHQSKAQLTTILLAKILRDHPKR